MNSLQQLQQHSDIVADTGDIESIKQFSPLDATTNPSLLIKAAGLKQYQALLSQAKHRAAKSDISSDEQADFAATYFATLIGQEISLHIDGLISTEVDARLSFDSRAMIEKARQIIRFYQQLGVNPQRILIKIAGTWQGIQAAKALEQEGIRCNITLLFCEQQAQAAADAGVFLISPFVGRITDWYKAQQNTEHFAAENDPGVLSVQRIYQHYKTQGYNTVIMAASFRNIEQIYALAGCDKLTISPTLLNQIAQDDAQITANLTHTGQTYPQNSAIDECTFLLDLNQNTMASEKLSEGIRTFINDQEQLEKILVTC